MQILWALGVFITVLNDSYDPWYLAVNLTWGRGLRLGALQTEWKTEMSIATCSLKPDSSRPEVGRSWMYLNLHIRFMHANHSCGALNCILNSEKKQTRRSEKQMWEPESSFCADSAASVCLGGGQAPRARSWVGDVSVTHTLPTAVCVCLVRKQFAVAQLVKVFEKVETALGFCGGNLNHYLPVSS